MSEPATNPFWTEVLFEASRLLAPLATHPRAPVVSVHIFAMQPLISESFPDAARSPIPPSVYEAVKKWRRDPTWAAEFQTLPDAPILHLIRASDGSPFILEIKFSKPGDARAAA